MPIAELVETWGYAAVILGTILEGEATVLLAAAAAQLGYLELGWVIAAAATGTFTIDQTLFFLGRHHAYRWVRKNALWRARLRRARELVHRFPLLAVFGFRFLYGMRTVIPIALGASRISPALYIPLNFAAVIAWALLFGYVGYALGRAAESLLPYLENAGSAVAALLVLALAVYGVVRYLRRNV